ncbi:hypothetical protein EJB05_41717, partial [Eragrostis curvula]
MLSRRYVSDGGGEPSAAAAVIADEGTGHGRPLLPLATPAFRDGNGGGLPWSARERNDLSAGAELELRLPKVSCGCAVGPGRS